MHTFTPHETKQRHSKWSEQTDRPINLRDFIWSSNQWTRFHLLDKDSDYSGDQAKEVAGKSKASSCFKFARHYYMLFSFSTGSGWQLFSLWNCYYYTFYGYNVNFWCCVLEHCLPHYHHDCDSIQEAQWWWLKWWGEGEDKNSEIIGQGNVVTMLPIQMIMSMVMEE